MYDMSENPAFQMILDRLDRMDENLKERAESQDKYWGARLDNVELIANKAHSRLDDHKKEILSLCDWKHQIAGAMWIIPIVLTPVTVLLTTWLLATFGVNK
jgi:hypothetical protein